jgi:hypothetical protein
MPEPAFLLLSQNLYAGLLQDSPSLTHQAIMAGSGQVSSCVLPDRSRAVAADTRPIASLKYRPCRTWAVQDNSHHERKSILILTQELQSP